MTLTEFLLKEGYQQLALSRSGVGHLHAAGTLNDRPVSVLFDTGGASSVFSLEMARQMGLRLLKMPFQGGGAGNAQMDIYQAPDAVLRLGEITPNIKALFAMDFSHINSALASKGQPPVDVVLGADAFDAHQAVIDYGSSSLFLR